MAKKIAEEAPDEVEATDANAIVEGDDVPEPGKTPDTEDILNTDGAQALNPNITVSGTKPDGKGGQVLLDTVDPEIANAALQPPKTAKAPENPSLPPEDAGRVPGDGEVWFVTTADNEPFWTGNGTEPGGPLKKGQRVVMTKEEAELLTQTRAGHIG